MENPSDQSQAQSVAEERVKVEEADGKDQGDNKGEGSATAGISDTQWRSMMDVVMAIYDFREEELVHPKAFSQLVSISKLTISTSSI